MAQDEDKTSETPKKEVKQSSTDSAKRVKEPWNEQKWKNMLTKILMCPKCGEEPIRHSVEMCSNGHSVCDKCKTGSVKCPICDADYLKAENSTLSQLASFLRYPCPNESKGCSVRVYLPDEASHLKTCPYSMPTEHRCKFDSCAWAGKKEDLLAHVESQHKGGIDRDSWGDMKFNEDHTYEDVKLIVHQYNLFWMLTKWDSEEKKLYKCCQFIGPPEYAEHLICEISLASAGYIFEVTYRNPVDDDTKERNSAYESDNCAVINFDTLQSIRSCGLGNKIKYSYQFRDETID